VKNLVPRCSRDTKIAARNPEPIPWRGEDGLPPSLQHLPVDRKLATAILAAIDQITVLAGVGENGPPLGKPGTRNPEQTAQSSRRILIIEDDPFSLELYTLLLEASGYTTLPAADGEAGLALARREKPDLIICDVKLPKLGGCEVVRDLKADGVLRSIPIIAVTILDSVGDRERLLATGFDGYIAKPIVAETFTRQIVGFLPEVQ
jgi:CheY-like chemotaxis protein